MISSGGITFRLDRLEAGGLVRRLRSDDDRRVYYAEITDDGRKLIDEVIEQHLAREHVILAALGADERDDLARMLAVLEQTMHDADPSAGGYPLRRRSPGQAALQGRFAGGRSSEGG